MTAIPPFAVIFYLSHHSFVDPTHPRTCCLFPATRSPGQHTMAESEPTAEQLAALAAANEETDAAVNYKPPAPKSLQEIKDLDKDDESLRKYKEALLGSTSVSAGEKSLPSTNKSER